MPALTKFLNLCKDYLVEEISGPAFKDAFEMYMFDFGDDIDPEVYVYLDNILDAVTYYDPGEFREDDEHFLQEDELRAAVKESLDKIEELL